MKLLLFALFVLIGFHQIFADLNTEWEAYKTKFEIKFNSEEDEFRKNIFAKNLKIIEIHQEKFAKGLVSYEMGLNEMAVLTDEEYKQKFQSDPLAGGEGGRRSFARNISMRSLPSRVNWLEYGYDNPVEKQGSCGCCYAFAAAGALEGQYYIKHKKKIFASVQDIIDCSKLYGNHGCHGGYQRDVYKYMLNYGGIGMEKDNPYLKAEDTCRKPTGDRITISDYFEIPSGDEEALKKAVASVGPIPVDFHSAQESFKLYKGGLYYEEKCKNDSKHLGHAMILMGYGKMHGTNEDYWLIKNSHGKNWGDHGYMYLARNRDNHCGVATRAVYPIVE